MLPLTSLFFSTSESLRGELEQQPALTASVRLKSIPVLYRKATASKYLFSIIPLLVVNI
jgi:hypothetical protein